MRSATIFVLFLMSVATSASAQVTRCQTHGTQTICRTFDGTIDGDGTMIGTFDRLFKGEPRKKVGKLLAKGDCEGATNVALKAGDLKLANEVAEYCAARTPNAPK